MSGKLGSEAVDVPSKKLEIKPNVKNLAVYSEPDNNHDINEAFNVNSYEALNIFHQNTQSLFNKCINLEALLLSDLKDIDVLCLSEHWLKLDEVSSVKFPKFSLASKYCREKKKCGGTCIFVKTDIEIKTLPQFENLSIDEHFEASMVELPSFRIVVICVYRNPSSDVNIMIEKLDFLLNYLQNKGKHVIIVGDLNLDFSHAQNSSTLCNMLNSYGLHPVVESPTRVSKSHKSTIDQVILNKKFWDFKITICDTGFSDHYAQILQIFNISGSKQNNKSSWYKIKRLCNKENIEYLNYLLGQENWENVFNSFTVNEAFSEFLNTFTYYFDIAAPKQKFKVNNKNNCNWVTVGIRTSGKRLRLLSRLLKEGNVSESFRNYCVHYKRIYNKVIREAKRHRYDNYINQAENKSKALWEIAKEELGQRKQSKNLVISKDGKILSDAYDIANVFNDHYTNLADNLLYGNKPMSKLPVKQFIERNNNTFFLFPATVEELTNIIKALKNKHSAGFDEVSDHLLKNCYTHILEPLCYIINLSLSTGKFPEQLKLAIVKPLFKKGSKENIENYRPVSILSVFSKILEKIMYTRLIGFVKKFHLISDEQHGFREGRSTTTAIANFLKFTYDTIDKKEIGMGLFIDLSKAFDLVDHDILLQKLSTMGIRGVALSWFKSYLSNREQIVKIESFDKRTRIASMNHSGRKFVRFGVPQGSILGPILFSLYVNDLGTNITTGNTVLYADDTGIFIQGDNLCTLQFLIKDTFNQLLEY